MARRARANHRTARSSPSSPGCSAPLLALATPLLPVKQTTAQLNWPQNGVLQQRRRAADRLRGHRPGHHRPLPGRRGPGRAANTARPCCCRRCPSRRPRPSTAACSSSASTTTCCVIVRNTPVVTAPLNQVLSPACQELDVHRARRQGHRRIRRAGQGPETPSDPGAPLRGERSGYDFRPQIVGVFTDLSGPAPPGLSSRRPSTRRYSTSPTLLKLIAMILGVAMTVVALVALHVLDTADGMRHRRFLPPRWWSIDAAGRPGHRGAGVVALRRRQHLRRRLHPDDGAGVRARRLHGELLPLVRHPRGAVRLVLRPAGAVGARQHHQRLDAAADAG